MGMNVTILGCSGSYPGPGESCSGYLIRNGDVSVCVDCGPGTIANLQRHVPLSELTAIVITHAHADHWSDAATAHVAFRYFFEREHIPVFGTAETLERLTVARGEDLAPTFDWHTITDGSRFTIDGLRFLCSVTDHPVETTALRIENGDDRSLIYSADTGSKWSLTELPLEADLVLCEAGALPEHEGIAPHLSPRQCGAEARAARAKRLVVTHLPPGTDRGSVHRQAEEAFGAEIEMAVTDVRYDV
jgi:ribonuclease BN (tRNA processing enzyme)